MYSIVEREKAQDSILELISEGQSLLQICKKKDLPSDRNVYRWLSKDKDFRHKYTEARGIQAQFYIEKIDKVLDALPEIPSREQLDKVRLIVDTYKWAAGRLAGSTYGTQQQTNIQVNIQPITGMQIIDVTDDEQE